MCQTTKPPTKRNESELAVANCASDETPYLVSEGVLMLRDGTFVCEGMIWDLKNHRARTA